MNFEQIAILHKELITLARKDNSLTIGEFMNMQNKSFYENPSTEIGAEGDFATICSIPSKREKLANMIVSAMFNAWKLEKKYEFSVVEFGAGSGDLMKEIHKIVAEKKSEFSGKPNSDEAKFCNSLNFTIMDLPGMIENQKKSLSGFDVKFCEYDGCSDKKISEVFGSKIDFGFSNEFFDTQPMEYVSVKEIDGNKAFFLSTVKMGQSGNYELGECRIDDETIKRNSDNTGLDLTEWQVGQEYPLQLGFLKAMHNFKESCTNSLHCDYFITELEDGSPSMDLYGKLRFCGSILNSIPKKEMSQTFDSPKGALICLSNLVCDEGIDVTYAPIIYKQLQNVFKEDCALGIFGENIKEQFVFIGGDAEKKIMNINRIEFMYPLPVPLNDELNPDKLIPIQREPQALKEMCVFSRGKPSATPSTLAGGSASKSTTPGGRS